MIEPNEKNQQKLQTDAVVSVAHTNGAQNHAPSPQVAPSAQVKVFDDAECVLFQSQMAERIGAGEDLSNNEHLLACERCSALLHDLESIVEAVRGILPVEEEPRDELWDQIQLAIARGDA
ncbi:anti-sigma factor [Acidicapsa ligni]|uniref:hypothetical protein n=1 Tax=Acidicapsa ligni TaxID=542300 RepID=UPI0021E0F6A1|nr:hypothetical protein [Acidicapsa ligni]